MSRATFDRLVVVACVLGVVTLGAAGRLILFCLSQSHGAMTPSEAFDLALAWLPAALHGLRVAALWGEFLALLLLWEVSWVLSIALPVVLFVKISKYWLAHVRCRF